MALIEAKTAGPRGAGSITDRWRRAAGLPTEQRERQRRCALAGDGLGFREPLLCVGNPGVDFEIL